MRLARDLHDTLLQSFQGVVLRFHAAFWDEIRQGRPPALALFNARRNYLVDIPHGQSAMWNLAVERKLYKQFTCLGLGWILYFPLS